MKEDGPGKDEDQDENDDDEYLGKECGEKEWSDKMEQEQERDKLKGYVKKNDEYSPTPHSNKLRTVHLSPDRPSQCTRASSTHSSLVQRNIFF